MPEFIDLVFAKTSPKRSFSVIENERVSTNSGTVVWREWVDKSW